jgi:dGTPase
VLVHDLVEASDIAGDIVQTPGLGEAMLALRTFLFEAVYLRDENETERRRVAHVVQALFEWFCEHPEELPPGPGQGDDLETRVVDHVAGMTDRFALRAYRDRFVPDGWEE